MNWTLLPMHQHDSALDGWLEHTLEHAGVSQEWTEFLLHFISDTITLFLLLIAVMFAVSLLQTYIPMERLRGRLAGLSSVWGYLLAMGLGVVSPFCSCTVIPVVLGFLSVGVPVPVALCYLTSAALLNGGSLVAVFSSLGLEFGLWYLCCAVVLAVGAPLLIRPFAGPDTVLAQVRQHEHSEGCGCGHEHEHSHNGTRFGYCLSSVGDVLRDTWLYLVLSVALSSAVSAFVPVQTLNSLLGGQNAFSPLLAGLVGAPIHADAFAALPLLRLLLPVNPAAALAFALGTLAISIPEVLLLTRLLKARAIAAYAAALTALSILAGYLFTAFTIYG